MTGAQINAAMPYRGRCGMCGGPDARHREWDSWRGQHRAGDPIERVARSFDRRLAIVRAVIRLSPQAYGGLMRRAANEAKRTTA